MNRLWWSLPGPAAFLDRVEHDLRDGKSAIVRLPLHGVDGCDEQLRRRLGADASTLEPDASMLPTEQLLRRYAYDHPLDAKRNVRAVVAAGRLHGRTLMVTLRADTDLWADWRDFIAEFAEESRVLDTYERTRFCLLVSGPPDDALPPADVCLAHHVWRDVTSTLDMDLYVSYLTRARPARLHWRTAAAVTSRIAIWDAEVADRLAEESLARTFDPAPVLEEIARERGWDGGVPAWANGSLNHVDGREVIHSAVLGDRLDLKARVWAGQVAVLFPYLEEQRRALLRVHTHRLRVPFQPKEGRKVENRDELELSHILAQMKTDGSAPRRTVDALRTLVEMRNELAHFDVVPADVLTDADLSYLADALDTHF